MESLLFEKFCPKCLELKRIRSFYAHFEICRSCKRRLARAEKTCGPCGRTLALNELHFYKLRNGAFSPWCRECSREEKTNRYATDPGFRTMALVNRQAYRVRNRVKLLTQERALRQTRKIQVLTHYGNGSLACVCCAESTVETLTLDHVDGTGADHRRELKKLYGVAAPGGGFIYKWLLDQNLPNGYQTLCFSCNVAKHRSKRNTCPHQLQTEALWQSFIDFVTTVSRPQAA